MIHFRGVLHYTNGRAPLEFKGGPVEWMAWERYAVSHNLPVVAEDMSRATPVNQALFCAWEATTRHEKPRPGFDTWSASIVDLTEYQVGSTPPTRPEASDASTQSSPSTPASAPASSEPATPATWQP